MTIAVMKNKEEDAVVVEVMNPIVNKQQQQEDERMVVDPEQRALECKEGNLYYGKRDFVQAAQAYDAGLQALEEQQPQEQPQSDPSLAIALRSNLAMVLLKMEEFQRADQECTKILNVDPQNTKGRFSSVRYRSIYIYIDVDRMCLSHLLILILKCYIVGRWRERERH
jgi:tetratricopeptide (TPR) repeat protein